MNGEKNLNKAWIVCLAAGLFFLYEFIQMDFFNSINQVIRTNFALNATQIGFLSILYNLATILMLIPVGLITDRFSLRKVITIAMSVSVTGTFMLAFSSSLEAAEISRIVSGAGGAFAFVCCVKLATHWFPAQKMSFVTGVLVSFAMLGGVMAQTPIILLTQVMLWRHMVLVLACCGVVIIFINLLIIRDFPEQKHNNKKQAGNDNQLSVCKSITMSLRNGQNWFCGLYVSLLNLPVVLLGSLWGNLYLVRVNYLTSIQAGDIISAMFLGIIVGAPSLGYLSDRIKRRKLPMLLCALLSALIIVLIITMHQKTLFTYIALFFLLGFVSSGQTIGYPTITESNPPAYNGTALSLGALIVMSGSVFRVVFGKILALHSGQYAGYHAHLYSAADFQVAILIMPVAFVVAFFVALFVKETYCSAVS